MNMQIWIAVHFNGECGSGGPRDRKRPHQHRQRHFGWPPAVQDFLDHGRRQQSHPQQATDVGRIDLLLPEQIPLNRNPWGQKTEAGEKPTS